MDEENSRQIYKNSIQDAVLPSRMYMNGIVFHQKDTLSCPVGKLWIVMNNSGMSSDPLIDHCLLNLEFGLTPWAQLSVQPTIGVLMDFKVIWKMSDREKRGYVRCKILSAKFYQLRRVLLSSVRKKII